MISQVTIENHDDWNNAIRSLPGVGILQTWEWGEVKSEYGWTPEHLIWQDDQGKTVAAALILIREIKIPKLSQVMRTVYIPQGPLCDWSNPAIRGQVIKDITLYSRKIGALFIKIDPEIIYGYTENIDQTNTTFDEAQSIVSELSAKGWSFSPQQVQFKNTAWIDLVLPEKEILARMKQKTRYNIRLAGRKGIRVRRGTIEDLDRLYSLYLETSLRDGFIIRPRDYYLKTWAVFMKSDMAVPLIAEFEGEMVAGLVLFHFANRAWYLYGMSSNHHRERMPNYLLQWEAIQLSKRLGCKIYDLWGAPDEFVMEDKMWGVYRFKKGLGCHPVQRIGAYDLPLNKFAYKIFVNYLPRVLSITRRIRRAQQIQELN